MTVMREVTVADRKATGSEVTAHAAAIRRLAQDLGLGRPRLRDDGAVIVHSDQPGYRSANRLSTAATRVVGAYVHVITDDVSGAAATHEL
jgi:hypothetical protein